MQNWIINTPYDLWLPGLPGFTWIINTYDDQDDQDDQDLDTKIIMIKMLCDLVIWLCVPVCNEISY